MKSNVQAKLPHHLVFSGGRLSRLTYYHINYDHNIVKAKHPSLRYQYGPEYDTTNASAVPPVRLKSQCHCYHHEYQPNATITIADYIPV